MATIPLTTEKYEFKLENGKAKLTMEFDIDLNKKTEDVVGSVKDFKYQPFLIDASGNPKSVTVNKTKYYIPYIFYFTK